MNPFYNAYSPLQDSSNQIPKPTQYYAKRYFEEDAERMEREGEELMNDNIAPQKFRRTTFNNPMMNVPIVDYDRPQIYQDYDRYDADKYPISKSIRVGEEVDQNLLGKLFQNPSDKLFERNSSERQWYSAPVGQIPSSQTEFAEWLWGTPGTCKAGSIWMRYLGEGQYTDDSLLCNGANVAEPTNFGHINDS